MRTHDYATRQIFLKNEIEKNILLRKLDIAKNEADSAAHLEQSEKIEFLIAFINREKYASMEVFKQKLGELHIF